MAKEKTGIVNSLVTTYRFLRQRGWLMGQKNYPISTQATPLGFDAWGRNKVVTDYSQFHGMFTFEIPDEMWIETLNGTEVPKTNAISVNGMLELSSNGNSEVILRSKRHPRYQPNRGMLYSDSGFIENATNESGTLYAVSRTLVNGIVEETTQEINLMTLRGDMSKGNIRDIQAQWRGAGDFKYFVNLKSLYESDVLGTLDFISVFNPAMPISFRVGNDGIVEFGVFTIHSGIFYRWVFDTPQDTTMRIGCVDITSEGGNKENRTRGSVDTEEISLSNKEIPVLLLNLPEEINYNGMLTPNTRDIAIRQIKGYADDDTLLKVYYSRDATKFTGTAWTNSNNIATSRYSTDEDIAVDNLTTNIKRIESERIPSNGNTKIENPDPDSGDLFVTSGDYLLVTMTAKNSTDGGASIIWGAEI